MNTAKSKDIIVVMGLILASGFVAPKIAMFLFLILFLIAVPVFVINLKRNIQAKIKGVNPVSQPTIVQTAKQPPTINPGQAYILAGVGSILLLLIVAFAQETPDLFTSVFYLIPFFLSVGLVPHILGKLLKSSSVVYRQAIIFHAIIVLAVFVIIQRDAIQGPGEIIFMIYYIPIFAPLIFAFSTSLSKIIINRA